MRLVFIPGLGFDCRIFENLQLSDFERLYLKWIEPLPKEALHDYAQRLFSSVPPSSKKTVLIGHSLGGVVAQEIASKHDIENIILISSITSRQELPQSFKLIKPLKLSKLFTKEVTINTIRFWGKGHGFETNSEKQLFKNMVRKQSNRYLQWAIRELSSWKAPQRKPQTSLIHIHGTNDKTLPYKLIKAPDFTITNGSHICVLKKGDEITGILKSIIQQ